MKKLLITCMLSLIVIPGFTQQTGSAVAAQTLSIILKSVVNVDLAASTSHNINLDAGTSQKQAEAIRINTINYSNHNLKLSIQAIQQTNDTHLQLSVKTASTRQTGIAILSSISNNELDLAEQNTLKHKGGPATRNQSGINEITLRYTISNQ